MNVICLFENDQNSYELVNITTSVSVTQTSILILFWSNSKLQMAFEPNHNQECKNTYLSIHDIVESMSKLLVGLYFEMRFSFATWLKINLPYSVW
jgi:hypothetical protein